MERTRVIIADDESLVRVDLREALAELGYLVVGEVGDGQSAVNMARELDPDVVVMDIKMPGLDGIEAARVLTQERIAPVVLLTAYSQKDLIERAKEALETRKKVERAKGILMEKQGMSESEAFRKIQKMSMNTRKPMKEVAEAIILANTD